VNFTASVFGVYSVNGGDITFTRTSSSLATSVAPGTTNVTLMQGTMRSNGIVNVENPTIDYATSLMTDSGAYLKFSTIYLTIGGSTFSYSPVANGTATGAAFLGSATINGTVPVRMYGTLKTTAPAGSIKFDSLRLDSFELIEYSNGNAVTTAVGSIEGINLTVESSTLNVTRTDGKGSQIIAKGTSDFTVLKMGLTSNQ